MPHMMGPDGFVCYHELDHNPGGNSLQDKKKTWSGTVLCVKYSWLLEFLANVLYHFVKKKYTKDMRGDELSDLA
jgi:hypothetical protein